MKKRFLNTINRVRQAPWLSRLLRRRKAPSQKTSIDVLVDDFFNHFDVAIANSAQSKSRCYKTRHDVYCSEMGYEPERADGMEHDEFDAYSVSCHITHKQSGECAGTIRVVLPRTTDQVLPMEQGCQSAMPEGSLTPDNFQRTDIAEVSRLAVPARFRRPLRPAAKLDSAHNQSRCSSLLSVALYLMATNVSLHHNIRQVYVMMEPRLARSMSFMGIRFSQLGDVIEYHGKRAAFSIVPEQLVAEVSPAMRGFQQALQARMNWPALVQVSDTATNQPATHRRAA
ncbi:PEP-CTERM/exosortase system-associated acyltransferase [Alteromonas halophila]|uniref:PEP-CTERM/exosortase system-associated acyltransferase n=1 Tax=Alteromonas halophila TaxID=516698 RepID=A0A918JPC3_9ALTE|nr:PEP-CTERM/exosortase system-associated acyltransferase [Alteromonas halophila]GGW88141.1 hypothetical protein GCM10007391_22410 [Alteromonas halophila]